MKPPKCRVCESEHRLGDPHIFKTEPKVSELLRHVVVHSPVVHAAVVHAVANAVVHKKAGEGRYRDADARKKYRREWMAKRRSISTKGAVA